MYCEIFWINLTDHIHLKRLHMNITPEESNNKEALKGATKP
jgi:hypothetical protein